MALGQGQDRRRQARGADQVGAPRQSAVRRSRDDRRAGWTSRARIAEIAHQVRGCLLCQASASALVVGRGRPRQAAGIAERPSRRRAGDRARGGRGWRAVRGLRAGQDATSRGTSACCCRSRPWPTRSPRSRRSARRPGCVTVDAHGARASPGRAHAPPSFRSSPCWALFAFPALAVRPGPCAQARDAVVGRPGLFRVRGHGRGRRDAEAHRCRCEQVDDVLKSLVVYDDKGGVGGLSLPGREPLAQAFKDLPFDQDSLSSPADLLSTLKGAQVTVGGAAPSPAASSRSRTRPSPLNDGKAIDQAHARHPAHRPRPAAVHPRGRREPAVRRRRPARQGRPGAARHPDQPRQGCAHARTVDARPGPAHGARRLHRRGAGVEGVVPPDPAGRSGGGALGPAGLGDDRESERPGLEGHRADAGRPAVRWRSTRRSTMPTTSSARRFRSRSPAG